MEMIKLNKQKFKIGDIIDFNDTLDSWSGRIRGIGVVAGVKNTLETVYLIEASTCDYDKEECVGLEWFEMRVEYVDTWGEINKLKH
tara:strand:+ start:9441 stop:9698 length:258 start_codon:yes stop_codon:yes gene_type:complete